MMDGVLLVRCGHLFMVLQAFEHVGIAYDLPKVRTRLGLRSLTERAGYGSAGNIRTDDPVTA